METQTVTIQVAPQTADILKAKAAAQGMSIDDLLLQLAEGATAAPPKKKEAGRKSLLGAFQHLKLEVTPEDIQEVRREMWKNFPREIPE
jgi:hypothetical protein